MRWHSSPRVSDRNSSLLHSQEYASGVTGSIHQAIHLAIMATCSLHTGACHLFKVLAVCPHRHRQSSWAEGRRSCIHAGDHLYCAQDVLRRLDNAP